MSPFKRLRRAVAVKEPLEKARSEGTDEPGLRGSRVQCERESGTAMNDAIQY